MSWRVHGFYAFGPYRPRPFSPIAGALLERALDARDSRVIFMAVDPILDCARPDPRFGALVARMGLNPQR